MCADARMDGRAGAWCTFEDGLRTSCALARLAARPGVFANGVPSSDEESTGTGFSMSASSTLTSSTSMALGFSL